MANNTTRPLKQVIAFKEIDELNAWLSARINDKYETDIRAISHGHYSNTWMVIYWEEK